MKVTLNVSEDKELRDHIKDVIKGQIRSVAREEIIAILKEILVSKIPEVNPDTVLKEHIVKTVKSQLDNGSWNNPSFVQREARLEVQKIVREILTKNPIV